MPKLTIADFTNADFIQSIEVECQLSKQILESYVTSIDKFIAFC
jgi:hypothetical protein